MPRSLHYRGEPLAIVIVEDDPVGVTACRRALAALDIEADRAIGARDGDEARTVLARLAREGRAALVLLDLHLPRVNGLELLEGLGEGKGGSPATLVIAVSASCEADDLDRARAGGVLAFVGKGAQMPARLGSSLRALGLLL